MRKSILKNKLIIFALITMGIFFVDVKGVMAKDSSSVSSVALEDSGDDSYYSNSLTNNDYTLQCIYADGGLYTYSYNTGTAKFVTNRNVYNLKGVSEIDNTASSLMQFLNVPFKLDDPNVSSYLTCADYVSSTVFVDPSEQTGENDPASPKGQSKSFYKFGGSITQDEITGNEKHWYNFWGYQNERQKAAHEAETKQQQYKLVSESYILSDDAPTPNATLYYSMPATQAAGTDKYVQVLVYNNVVLLKSDSLTTRLEDSSAFSNVKTSSSGKTNMDPPATLNINDPEPTTEVTGGKIYYSYKNGQVRYSTNGSNSYGLTNPSDLKLNPNDDSELCDEVMPETAKVLRDVIQYARFLVPAFLIVLVAVDLAKIVVSGNIDEEMPKQRKKVVTRIVVAVVFFFLPFLVNLFLDLAIDSGEERSKTIQTIDCLFE